MRALFSSAMAALVVVAMFLGNCLSCPQVLISLASHKASHDCCKRGQKPAAQTCDTQGLRHFVKADPAQTAPPVLDAAPVEAAPAPVVLAWQPALTASSETVHAPPDRLSLNSVFRI